jgi:hypothetical protein
MLLAGHDEEVGSASVTMDAIRGLLADSRRHRYPGVRDGLVGIRDLKPLDTNPAMIECPVMTCDPQPWTLKQDTTSARRKVSRAKDDEEFRERFVTMFPNLQYFDFSRYGMVVAGGSVSALLMHSVRYCKKRKPFQDIDIFLVGHTSEEQVKEAIKALVKHLSMRFVHPDEATREPPCQRANVTITRSLHTVTLIRAKCPPIQIILRQYSTLAEVLHGFDNGACAAAFDGHKVFLSGLGAFAAERMSNIVCLDGRRGSYERRLVKYFNRGYDIILPNLDVKAYRIHGCRLPFLGIMWETDTTWDSFGLPFHVMVVRQMWAVPNAVPDPKQLFPVATYEDGHQLAFMTDTDVDVYVQNISTILSHIVVDDDGVGRWPSGEVDSDILTRLRTMETFHCFGRHADIDDFIDGDNLFLNKVTVPKDLLRGVTQEMTAKAVFAPSLRFGSKMLNVAMRGSRIGTDLMDCVHAAFDPDRVLQVVNAKIRVLEEVLQSARLYIPFQLRGVAEDTLLTTDGPHLMPLEVWYGNAFTADPMHPA